MNTNSRMGYHALSSLEIWDRIVHVIIFYESTNIRMYMYVVILNQNTLIVRNTLFWGPGWRRGAGQQVFSSLQGGRTENFQSSLGGGNRCFSTYVSNFRIPLVGINDTSLTLFRKTHEKKYEKENETVI